jgi:hypothetical protein
MLNSLTPLVLLLLGDAALAFPSLFEKRAPQLETDLSFISRHWGQISVYAGMFTHCYLSKASSCSLRCLDPQTTQTTTSESRTLDSHRAAR